MCVYQIAGQILESGAELTLSEAECRFSFELLRWHGARRDFEIEAALSAYTLAMQTFEAIQECQRWRRAGGWRDPYAPDREARKMRARLVGVVR
jgi:hypothetical protein